MVKGPRRKQAPATVELKVRYQCPECETVLDEGERRCESCHKFGRRVEGIECPHCGDFIKQEDML